MHLALNASMARNPLGCAVALSFCAVFSATAGTAGAQPGIPGAYQFAETSNAELLFQLQPLAEAEQNRYTIRRVEFIGNEHIRDYVLRRRTRGLQEGEIFRRAVLKQSLASLSRLKTIVPIAVKDVEVHLDRKEKLIDLVIPIRERRRTR